jgi:hypothetical protein
MSGNLADVTVVDSWTRSASRFYWGWLVFATTVSVLGNITHALLVAPNALRLLAAVASVVPPAFVLGSTHSVALSLRMRRFAPTYVLGLLMTMGVAACAFFLSFDALRALAVILGWPPGRAWLFPVAIDVSIAQATFGLLSLAPAGANSALSQSTAADLRQRLTTGTSTAGARQEAPHSNATADAGRAPEIPEAVAPLLVAEPTGVLTTSADASDILTDTANTAEVVQWTHTAQQLVRNGTTSKDPEVVAAILAEHAAGTPPSTISRRRGVHHSTVGRILAGAAALTN